MRDNAMLALRWIEAVDEALFAEDRARFYAVTRCLEIISEASRRLRNDLIERHSKYDWRGMRDAGNTYQHQYDGVEERQVYNTVLLALPPLLAIIDAELGL